MDAGAKFMRPDRLAKIVVSTCGRTHDDVSGRSISRMTRTGVWLCTVSTPWDPDDACRTTNPDC